MTLDLKTYASEVRVTDGAWGTELQRRGLPAGACPELWNVQNADAVAGVAAGYVDAGSDVIITNTFGGNRFVLAAHGAGDRVAELVVAGVAISRHAAGRADRNVKVFASIGPSGKIVMMGEVAVEELSAAFEESAAAAAEGGADAIVLESFGELDEIAVALTAAGRAAPHMPVVASMTFASGPDRTATMMGNSPGDLAAMAEANGAAGVGANCGLGPENYVRVAELLRRATDLPVWIKANAGLPVVAGDGTSSFPMGPEEFGACAPRLASAGANFIGGCCGTTPKHIRAIRKAIDSRPAC